MNSKFWSRRWSALLLVSVLMCACSAPTSNGTYAWIDVPLDGLALAAVQPITIEGHAASPQGISRVEIWIDGLLLTTITDPPSKGTLASFHTPWTPPGAGTYTIQVVAYDSNGQFSDPDSARVSFGVTQEAPTPSAPPTETPTPMLTETPTPLPEAVIEFWADPTEVDAGECTTVHWRVENVTRIYVDGVEQAFDGTFEDCPCERKTYMLTAYLLDGSVLERTLDLLVSGACTTPTPTPPPDTTPPPAPTPVVPASGLTLSCRGSQALSWLPAEDPSGIAEYRVEVQRHSGDNNWQAAPGGQITVYDKTTSIPVECAWYYRWRVRAVDGAGNIGPWSEWSEFTITLG